MSEHQHKWEETARIKLAPLHTGGIPNFPAGINHSVLMLVSERTAVHLKCSECGDVASRTLEGWDPAEFRAISPVTPMTMTHSEIMEWAQVQAARIWK
jgi:hypothetical protein